VNPIDRGSSYIVGAHLLGVSSASHIIGPVEKNTQYKQSARTAKAQSANNSTMETDELRYALRDSRLN
jgi:hypothetical protein